MNAEKCNHIIGIYYNYLETCIVPMSSISNKKVYDGFGEVFNYCPECGEDLKEIHNKIKKGE